LDVSLVLLVQVGEDARQPLLGGSLSGDHGLLLVLAHSSLFANGGLSGLLVLFVGHAGGLTGGFGVGVQFVHVGLVGEGVLLLLVVSNEVGLHGVDHALDFIGIDEAGHVGVVQDGLQHVVAFLEGSGLSGGTEDAVESLDGGLGVNHESAELSTGGQSLQGETVDVDDFNTGHVAEGLDQTDVFVGVDDQRSLLLLVTLVSELAFASTDGLGVNDLLDVFISSELLEEGNGLRSLLDGFKTVFDNQGEFGHVADAVTAGLDEGSQGGGGQSHGDSVSSLLEVDLSVPSAVGLEGEGHATSTDHVTEGSLARAGSSGAGNTGNSGDGTSGTPRGSRVAHTGLGINSVGLTGVLGQVSVNELDDVQADGALEHTGQDNLLVSHLGGIFHVEYREQRSRGHRFLISL
jgi:hypothetical protein